MGTGNTSITATGTGARTIRTNAQTAQACALGADGKCAFCQRTGFPILPVRYAAIPAFLAGRPANVLGGAATLDQFADKPLTGHKYTLRTVRQGFIHVYLGSAGLWQSYVVSGQGYLRKLANPDDPDFKTERELTASCMRGGDNVPASFINIPPGYPKVWIAFSETPWTRKVRTALEKAPARRMQDFDIEALKAAPDAQKHAFELTSSAAKLSALVDEYAVTSEEYVKRTTYLADDPTTHKKANFRWDSAFGLPGRGGQLEAIGAYAKTYAETVKARSKKECKVPVVALHDPVGIVKETNHTRLYFVESKQNYCTRMMRPLIVAQSINGLEKIIRESTLAQRAKTETAAKQPDVQTHYIATGNDYAPSITYTDTRAERAKSDADAAWSRLEKRLKPGAKKAFEEDFKAGIKAFDSEIAQFGADWSAWAKDPLWASWLKDYDVEVEEMRGAIVANHAACLAGGITDIKSAEVWKKWLADNPFDDKNPLYRTLFGERKAMLPFLTPGEDGKLNKTDKLYDTVKSLAVSEQGEHVKAGAAQIVLAIAGALGHLREDASKAAHQTALRAHQAAMLLYQKIEVTLLNVQMTVGEYHKLLSDLAFEKKNTLTRAVEGLIKDGQRVVKSVAIAGIFSVRDPKVRDTVIDVTLWTFDTAQQLKGQLDALGKSVGQGAARAGESVSVVMRAAGQGAAEAIRVVRVSAESINREAAQLISAAQGRLTVGASQLREFAKDISSRSMRVAAGSGEILLVAGAAIFQSWAVKDSLQDTKEKIGAANAEAQLGLVSAGAGVTGAAVELVGQVVVKAGAKKLGERLVFRGGVIAAIAGIVDSVQCALASARSFGKGDVTAGRLYAGAATLFFVGAAFGVYATIIGASSLLGPFGIALGLVVIGVVALWAAINAESTLAEIWMDRCYFGKGERSEGKWTDAQAAQELEHLNAIVVGLGAEIGFDDNLLGTKQLFTDYDTVHAKLTFGDYSAERSSLEWTLYVHHRDGRKFPVTGGRAGLPPIPSEVRAWDGKKSPDDIERWFKNWQSTGKIDNGAFVVEHTVDVCTEFFQKISLDASYHIDKSDDAALATVHIEEKD